MKKLEKEEKEEYQPYAWNKKKEKYVPVGKPQPSLNLCKECLLVLVTYFQFSVETRIFYKFNYVLMIFFRKKVIIHK